MKTAHKTQPHFQFLSVCGVTPNFGYYEVQYLLRSVLSGRWLWPGARRLPPHDLARVIYLFAQESHAEESVTFWYVNAKSM